MPLMELLVHLLTNEGGFGVRAHHAGASNRSATLSNSRGTWAWNSAKEEFRWRSKSLSTCFRGSLEQLFSRMSFASMRTWGRFYSPESPS